MTRTVSANRSGRRVLARTAAAGSVVLALAAGFAGGRASLVASGQPSLPAAVGPDAVVPAVAPVASYSPVVDRVAPAVVTVRVEKATTSSRLALPEGLRDFFGRGIEPQPPRRESGLGSGVIVRSDGHVLTNNHVIDGATKIRVDLADGRTVPAKLVGADPASDLAVLSVEAKNLPALAFGDSDRLKVGDVVLAFGNPLGVGQTVTMGIVSAKGRATGIGDGNYEDFLQTDAPINQGNSGGPLVNLQGELVGINAQILSPTGGNIGLGFAIPSSMARAVVDQLTTDGVVHRSKLGVTVQGVTADLALSLGLRDAHGALISGVESGSPADRAGLRQGDVIVALDHKPVDDANTLRNRIASTRPGSSVTVDILRGGQTESKSVRLVEREETTSRASAAPGTADDQADLGLTLRPLTPDVAASLGVGRGQSGVVVADIDPDSPAASAGLQAGDVITRVNNRDVASVASVRAALNVPTERPALLLVTRHGANLFIALPHDRS